MYSGAPWSLNLKSAQNRRSSSVTLQFFSPKLSFWSSTWRHESRQPTSQPRICHWYCDLRPVQKSRLQRPNHQPALLISASAACVGAPTLTLQVSQRVVFSSAWSLAPRDCNFICHVILYCSDLQWRSMETDVLSKHRKTQNSESELKGTSILTIHVRAEAKAVWWHSLEPKQLLKWHKPPRLQVRKCISTT